MKKTKSHMPKAKFIISYFSTFKILFFSVERNIFLKKNENRLNFWQE